MNQFDEIYFQKYLGEEENFLFVCHRHPILVIDNVLLWCFFGGVVPIFFYLQNTFGFSMLVEPAWFEMFLISIYLCIIYHVFDWYNDVWVITNRGIIDITWNIFTGSRNYISYESVHGIEVQSNSIFDSILNKGDVIIHLQSNWGEFQLPDASNPQAIVEYIHAVIQEIEENHNEEPIDDRKPFELLLDTLTEMVRDHLEKKGTTESNVAKKEEIDRALRFASTVDLRGADSRDNDLIPKG